MTGKDLVGARQVGTAVEVGAHRAGGMCQGRGLQGIP